MTALLLATWLAAVPADTLVVGTLAEEGAKAIGANSLFCRVAAFYHDIGKIRKPEYYIENQRGVNPHERLQPSMSALIISAHVKDGIRVNAVCPGVTRTPMTASMSDEIRERAARMYPLGRLGEPRDIAAMIVKQAIALGVIGFAVGKIAATLWGPFFPRYVLLEPGDAVRGFAVVMVVSVLGSMLAVRAALKIDPATAIGG